MKVNRGKLKGVAAMAFILAFVLGLAPVTSRASMGLPNGQEVATPQILQTCAIVPEPELREMRGRFQSYFFGMDVAINLSSPHPSFKVNFTANVPEGSGTPQFTGKTASFHDGNVNFQAGIGNTSLGSGVFNVTQVAGNNNVVVSTMNLNINMGKIPLISTTGLSTPATLAGILH